MQGVYDPEGLAQEEARRLYQVLRRRDTRRAAKAMILQAVPLTRDRLPDPDKVAELVADYANVTVPTLMVWGNEDRVLPIASGHRLVKQLPDARLTVVENSMHALATERPRVTADAIRTFLAQDPSTTAAGQVVSVDPLSPPSVGHARRGPAARRPALNRMGLLFQITRVRNLPSRLLQQRDDNSTNLKKELDNEIRKALSYIYDRRRFRNPDSFRGRAAMAGGTERDKGAEGIPGARESAGVRWRKRDQLTTSPTRSSRQRESHTEQRLSARDPHGRSPQVLRGALRGLRTGRCKDPGRVASICQLRAASAGECVVPARGRSPLCGAGWCGSVPPSPVSRLTRRASF